MMNKKWLIAIVFITGIVAVLQIAEAAIIMPSGITVSNTKYEPYPAEPGNYLELWLLVKNNGDKAAENVVLKLEPEYPFSLDREQDAYATISYMTGGGEAVVSFKVRVDVNAMDGISQIKMKYWAGGDTGAAITDTFYIQVSGKKNIEISEISPLILKPGEVTNLNFTIANKGRSPIQDITFTWQESKDTILPVGSDNKRYVQFIDVDQSVQVSFKVAASPSASPGVYSLMMSLSYTDINRTQSVLSSRAGIVIGGGTEFEVTLQDSTGGTLSLTIANVGVNPSYSVSVWIPQQPGVAVSGSSSTMIGNLDPSDYTYANFQLSMNSTDNTVAGQGNQRNFTGNPGQEQPVNPNKLLVNIQYTDTLGQRQIVTEEVILKSLAAQSVYGSQSFARSQTSNTSVIYIGGAAAAIVLALGIWKKDKILGAINRRKKQANQK